MGALKKSFIILPAPSNGFRRRNELPVFEHRRGLPYGFRVGDTIYPYGTFIFEGNFKSKIQSKANIREFYQNIHISFNHGLFRGLIQ